MCAPRRRRVRIREISVPGGTDLELIAKRAHYVGSPEHKDAPSFAGRPRPRADATICDRSFAAKQRELARWLRKAIRTGIVGGPWEGSFPRYAWYRHGDTLYQARLVSREQGGQKGYALLPEEWPRGMQT